MRGTRRRIWLLVAMVALLMLALGTAVSAQVQDGPIPPELGDPVNGTQIVPHGGYSSSTNFCMQCHDVHDALGDYALMAAASVEATCSTCHSVYGGATSQPAGGPDPTDPPGPATNDLGTVSLRTSYDVSVGARSTHTLGRANIPGGAVVTQSDWDYGTWKYGGATPAPGGPDASTPANVGTSDGPPYGLYCATCHTPHGEYGQMVNNWTGADEGTAIQYEWAADVPNPGDSAGWADAWLDLDGSWFMCRLAADVAAGGGHGANCIDATIADAEAQEVSLFGYKLLSAYPNHTYTVQQSYNLDTYNHDGALWCASCHVQNDPSDTHNHQTGCSACHGNPGDATSADFPHTSTADRFLIDYPDALCIGCHTPGTLP